MEKNCFRLRQVARIRPAITPVLYRERIKYNSGNIEEVFLFIGDVRAQENPQLALTQTLMMREHNRLARALTVINPQWDDETLFQEARRIVIAEIQHITYNEYLPVLLGAARPSKLRSMDGNSNFCFNCRRSGDD